MRVEVTGRHLEITPAIRLHVESELKKLSNLFPNDAAQAHVVVEVEKNRQKAEIVLTVGERTMTANVADKDLYLALSRTVAKIEKQALRLKEKRVDRRQSAMKTAEIAPEPGGQITAEPAPKRIRAAQQYLVKPMTADEAALSLESSTNQFIVFRDAETENLSVLYKRADGDYGLIQP